MSIQSFFFLFLQSIVSSSLNLLFQPRPFGISFSRIGYLDYLCSKKKPVNKLNNLTIDDFPMLAEKKRFSPKTLLIKHKSIKKQLNELSNS